MYYIYIDTNCYEVMGVEAAWEAYNKAIAFAEAVGAQVDLCDAETLEVIASTYEEPEWDAEDDLEEPYDPEEPYDLDMGFNPYMGMYDYDC